jgi:hypothetical protein
MRGSSVSHIYTPGKGINVKVEWNGIQFTDMEDYYKKVILSMPQEGGAFLGAQIHLDALAYLGCGGLLIAERDEADVYVDGWLVNSAFITHKHPEFGKVEYSGWVDGIVECGLHHGACELCGKAIPGEIEMMHYFYRLDG